MREVGRERHTHREGGDEREGCKKDAALFFKKGSLSFSKRGGVVEVVSTRSVTSGGLGWKSYVSSDCAE